MPTTLLQAAQSRLPCSTDTGSNVSSIEGVANVSFDDYIKWHIDHNPSISALVEGEESVSLRARENRQVIDVSIPKEVI